MTTKELQEKIKEPLSLEPQAKSTKEIKDALTKLKEFYGKSSNMALPVAKIMCKDSTKKPKWRKLSMDRRYDGEIANKLAQINGNLETQNEILRDIVRAIEKLN